MQRRHFLRSVSSLSAAAALLPAHTWAQGAKPALTPVKFTLDFKVTSQTASPTAHREAETAKAHRG